MSSTICFCNGKGGTGKSTLAMLAAWVLRDRGQRVVIDDRDPQGNATAVAELFGVPVLGQPTPLPSPAGRVSEHEFDYTIIDTCPDIERPSTLEAIRDSDLVVLVTRPEFFDLVSTIATASVVQRERDPARPTCVVFNQARLRTLVTQEMLDARGRIPFPAVNAVIHQRAGYSRANRHGPAALGRVERAEAMQLVIELLTQQPRMRIRGEHATSV